MALQAAILRLPVETMAEIFKFSQLPSRDRLGERRKHSNWRWITFTHVCRRWRYIAINTQHLWTSIDIKKYGCLERTGVFLERSGASPLDIVYDSLDGRAFDSLCLALCQLYRIRKLHIQKIQHPDNLIVMDLINRPAPLLQEFTFETNSDAMVDITMFFAGHAPKLTSLSLSTNLYGWTYVPIMQNLKDLCISNYLNLINFLSVILQNSTYETLSIKSLSNGDIESFLAQRHIKDITMPSLKNLSLSDANYAALSQLFRIVNFPALKDWDIECNEFPLVIDETATDPKIVIPRASKVESNFIHLEILISSKLVKITASAILYGSEKSWSRRSITYSWDDVLGPLDGEPFSIQDGLTFVVSVIEGEFWCSATDLTVIVCFNDADDLQYWAVDGKDFNQWRTLLGELPKIERITIKSVWTDNPAAIEPGDHYHLKTVRTETHLGFLNALGTNPDYWLTEEGICPKLHELHLFGFDLRDTDRVACALKPLKDRLVYEYADYLNLLCLTDVLTDSSTYATNLKLFEDSDVARVIRVVDENNILNGCVVFGSRWLYV